MEKISIQKRISNLEKISKVYGSRLDGLAQEITLILEWIFNRFGIQLASSKDLSVTEINPSIEEPVGTKQVPALRRVINHKFESSNKILRPRSTTLAKLKRKSSFESSTNISKIRKQSRPSIKKSLHTAAAGIIDEVPVKNGTSLFKVQVVIPDTVSVAGKELCQNDDEDCYLVPNIKVLLTTDDCGNNNTSMNVLDTKLPEKNSRFQKVNAIKNLEQSGLLCPKLKAENKVLEHDSHNPIAENNSFAKSDLKKHRRGRPKKRPEEKVQNWKVRTSMVCDECGKVLKGAGSLKCHKQIHSNSRPYECHICKKNFRMKHHLDFHILTHEGEKKWTCRFCTKGFLARRDLLRHERTHTGERPFACPYPDCKKSFNVKQHLTLHIRTHTGEKPYKCSICDKAFTQANSLRIHKKIHIKDPTIFTNLES